MVTLKKKKKHTKSIIPKTKKKTDTSVTRISKTKNGKKICIF